MSGHHQRRAAVPDTGGGADSPGPQLTWISRANTTSDSNSYTWSSQDVGTAASDRFVVVCPFGARKFVSGTLNSVTIAGNTMTEAANVSSPGWSKTAGIFWYNLTSGTTADIVVSFSGNQFSSGIDVFTMNLSGDPTTIDSVGAWMVEPADNTETGLNINTEAICTILAYGSNADDTHNPHTWVGATEQFDYFASTEGVTCAINDEPGASTPHTLKVTADNGMPTTNEAYVAWSFKE